MERKHLYEIDLMRAFIMLGVLSVHTTSFFNDLNRHLPFAFATFGALITSLHFTREAFMWITGLVLFITYYRRPFHTWQFWKKRFFLIAIPYIVWTIVYILFRGALNPSFQWTTANLLSSIRHSLETGNQYFLYYIVVSMQLYLVFPFLLRALRKFERYHVQILIGSFILQLLFMAFNKFVLMHVDPSSLGPVFSRIDRYRDRFILTYQFWFIAGGIIACHYELINNFLRRHARALVISLVVGTLIVWGHYFFDRFALHEAEGLAELVLQPIMIPYSLLVAANMWYAGLQWSDRRQRPGWMPFSRFVKTASNASFGIFLLQPFPLYYMEWTVHHLSIWGIPLWIHYCLWPFSILFVYFSGMFGAYWLGKIPVISYCVGRKTDLFRRKPKVVQTTA